MRHADFFTLYRLSRECIVRVCCLYRCSLASFLALSLEGRARCLELELRLFVSRYSLGNATHTGNERLYDRAEHFLCFRLVLRHVEVCNVGRSHGCRKCCYDHGLENRLKNKPQPHRRDEEIFTQAPSWMGAALSARSAFLYAELELQSYVRNHFRHNACTCSIWPYRV